MDLWSNTTGRTSGDEAEEKTVHVEVDVEEDGTINVDVEVGGGQGSSGLDVEVGVKTPDDDWAGPRKNNDV